MKTRVLRYTLCIAALPVGSIFLILHFRGRPLLTGALLLLTAVFQLPVIQSCKRAMRPFICPDAAVLLELGVDYLPAAYEPGRFGLDARISSGAMWLSLGAPALIWLGTLLPPPPIARTMAEMPGTPVLFYLVVAAVLLLFFGTLAFPYWFETSRAAAIYAEGSDRKRYLLCGFAEKLQHQSCLVQDYLHRCKGRCS